MKPFKPPFGVLVLPHGILVFFHDMLVSTSWFWCFGVVLVTSIWVLVFWCCLSCLMVPHGMSANLLVSFGVLVLPQLLYVTWYVSQLLS